ncbi:MAG: hypothetical protein ACI96M_002480 [Candidatus Azotimanducaceae bacterium]
MGNFLTEVKHDALPHAVHWRDGHDGQRFSICLTILINVSRVGYGGVISTWGPKTRVPPAVRSITFKSFSWIAFCMIQNSTAVITIAAAVAAQIFRLAGRYDQKFLAAGCW